MQMQPIQFDPDFASGSEYARLYRQLGLQVVPSYHPSEAKAWKRPLLTSWKEFEHTLVPEEQFNRWWGPEGSHLHKSNLGILTGECSNGAFVLDVDHHTHSEASAWLMNLLESYNEGRGIICPTQRTGGGGNQYLLRAPQGWVSPTIKTPIGIDIRGQGGFCVFPSSQHESGNYYEWAKGLAPWDIEIPEAPPWLIAAIDELAGQYGRGTNAGQGQKTPTPQYATTAFGTQITDGREDYMTRLVFARVVALRRESPFLPSSPILQQHMKDSFTQYERAVKSRINEPGTPNHVLLEREGRGHTLFQSKWHTAVSQWDQKISEAASIPNPKDRHLATPRSPTDAPQDPTDMEGPLSEWEPEQDIYELLSEAQIMALPDPEFLIQGLVIKNGLGFIFSPPGAGKSFIALGMALTIATGQGTWWGREVKQAGPVIMIASEGVSDMKNRIRAWRKHFQITDTSDFYLIRQTINFMDVGDKDKLHRTVADLVSKINKKPALVIVDTLSRAIAGQDENDQAAASTAVQSCDALREAWDATVICVHHSSKAGQMRGSTVFAGAADFIVSVERESGSQTGIIRADKIKQAADGWTEGFNLISTSVGELHEGLESLVAIPAPVPIKTANDWPEPAVIRIILQAIQKAWDEGKPWSPHKQSKRTGTYVVANMTRWGITEDMAEKMVESWLANKVLSYDTCNTKAHLKGLRVIDASATPYKDAGRRSGEEAESLLRPEEIKNEFD